MTIQRDKGDNIKGSEAARIHRVLFDKMKNIILLQKENHAIQRKVTINSPFLFYNSHAERFDGYEVSRILRFANTVIAKYSAQKLPVLFQFGSICLVDKLSYIIFECICYELMNNYGHPVTLYWEPQNYIRAQGIFSSPLKLLNTRDVDTKKRFLEKFKYDIYLNHFRKIISGNEKGDTNYLGILQQDIDVFLKSFFIVEEYRDQIAEVIVELVGNACEHANTECLLDIDITEDFVKTVGSIEQEGNYYGINIVILNFSDILLGDGIKGKIEGEEFSDGRYKNLQDALAYHKKYFSDNYTYEDFCNISALQDKISGRKQYINVGGTGLTKLIHSLQEKSDDDACYVLSGNRIVMFIKQFLNYDSNNWLGFNTSSNFLSAIPDSQVTEQCNIYFPGTAYNLNFIMKREKENNGNND